jgi:hypothetical protein
MRKRLTEQEAAAKRYEEARMELKRALLEAEDSWAALSRLTADEFPERADEKAGGR